jgi:hypothetical protein
VNKLADKIRTIPFSDLARADLYIDAIYEGNRRGGSGDDPFNHLLKVSNMGGFRYRGSIHALEMVVLTSNFGDPDWPDELDRETGVFTYFGDNKHPGRLLHETPRGGNEILKRVFEDAHESAESRMRVPPIFVFLNTGNWRDVVFLGLAVPGSADIRPSEDLVAVWKNSGGNRFQNYRARFTVLDVAVVTRNWIDDILACNPHSENAPAAWNTWAATGRPIPLMAARSVEYRTKAEQLPSDRSGKEIISVIHRFFRERPHSFERCAAAITRLMLPDIAAMDITRPSRDGGRDATGRLRLGTGDGSILVDFALEAKCYGPGNSVGVREMSRLISRLRHRQFGVMVTTSFVNLQAYQEIKEDQHPIIVISAKDIVELLTRNGLGEPRTVKVWLEREFPRD